MKRSKNFSLIALTAMIGLSFAQISNTAKSEDLLIASIYPTFDLQEDEKQDAEQLPLSYAQKLKLLRQKAIQSRAGQFCKNYWKPVVGTAVGLAAIYGLYRYFGPAAVVASGATALSSAKCPYDLEQALQTSSRKEILDVFEAEIQKPTENPSVTAEIIERTLKNPTFVWTKEEKQTLKNAYDNLYKREQFIEVNKKLNKIHEDLNADDTTITPQSVDNMLKRNLKTKDQEERIKNLKDELKAREQALKDNKEREKKEREEKAKQEEAARKQALTDKANADRLEKERLAAEQAAAEAARKQALKDEQEKKRKRQEDKKAADLQAKIAPLKTVSSGDITNKSLPDLVKIHDTLKQDWSPKELKAAGITDLDASRKTLEKAIVDAISKAELTESQVAQLQEQFKGLPSTHQTCANWGLGSVVGNAPHPINAALNAAHRDAPAITNRLRLEEWAENQDRPLEPEDFARHELDKWAKNQDERQKQLIEEAERLARVEAERLAQEETERLARVEAERLAQEETERLARVEANNPNYGTRFVSLASDALTAATKTKFAHVASDMLKAAAHATSDMLTPVARVASDKLTAAAHATSDALTAATNRYINAEGEKDMQTHNATWTNF